MAKITFNERSQQVNPEKPYYMGLDIGVASLGYALTKPNYEIIRKGKKALWGVHLFKEASSKEARRGFRTARRRRKREKMRIRLLQEYFANAINDVDPGFFIRMKDSFFLPDDKSVHQTNTLFNDENYNDQIYHHKYPTIYHLRLALQNSTEPHDVREVYLALHHLMKNRGHFLTANLSVDDAESLDSVLEEFNQCYELYLGQPLWSVTDQQEIIRTLTASTRSRTDKEHLLFKLIEKPSTAEKGFCKLLVGNTSNVRTLFPEIVDKEDEETKLSFSFSKGYLEDVELQTKLESILGEHKEVIDATHNLYNAILLQELLKKEDGGRHRSISAVHVATYEKHGEDLKYLKSLLRQRLVSDDEDMKKLTRMKYDRIFRDNEKNLNNYVAYSGHTDSSDNISPDHHCTQEQFNKFLSDELDKYLSNEEYSELFEQLNQGSFMPRIRSTINGVVPYQLNERELVTILENASQYLAFLTDEIKDEIRQIFAFRIPYYVGPFDDRSEFAWLKRNSYEPIRPWNLDSVVDIPQTSENFIKRMTNKCTYLLGEDVLPKESLLYSEYLVRNALNVLTIDGNRLDKECRDYLFENLFVASDRSGRITKKRILSLLNAVGIEGSEETLGGMDQAITARLRSYQNFRSYLEEGILTPEDVENIIEKLSVFPESRDLVIRWISEEFDGRLTSKQVEHISSFKYKDWGRLSRKLLTELYYLTPEGELLSIIDIMRLEPMNLMEILFDKQFKFNEKIEEENKSILGENEPNSITDEYLDELNLSSPVRKAINKTLKLVKELTGIMGSAPDKIFVEMPRENLGEAAKAQARQATTPRKQRLMELYKALGDDCDLWNKELEKLPDERFKSKALYLYAQQRGRCMYSGEEINISELGNKNLYDIDHIYPRSLTKDDSFNNLVLVKSKLNRDKSDSYPLSNRVQKEMRSFWDSLRAQGFLTEEKHKRLVRTRNLTAEELENFVARQLVETRQTTKVIAQILQRIMPNTRIVYVKAGLISDFRYLDGLRDDATTQFYFPKVRALNSLHHAKDAYLNVVVGNVYYSKFTKNFYKNLRTGARQYNLVRLFDFPVDNAWTPGPDGSINTVKKMLRRNNVLLSHEVRRESGGFYDQQLVKKEQKIGSGKHPIKSQNPALARYDQYGSYNKVSASYFSVVRHINKGKVRISFVEIPVHLHVNKPSAEDIEDYLEQIGLESKEVLFTDILIGATINLNGVQYRVIAKNGTQLKCALPFTAYYTLEQEEEIKKLERYQSKGYKEDNIDFDLDRIYLDVVRKLVSHPFSDYSNMKNQGTLAIDEYERYQALDNESKVKVIFSFLELLTGAGRVVDLRLVGGSSQAGMITINRSMLKQIPLAVEDTSISGFYKKTTEIV